jgi:Na+/melibiose symporter-like transporter
MQGWETAAYIDGVQATAADFNSLDYKTDCMNLDRGPNYQPSFPTAFCHCANQCFTDDKLKLSRSGYTYAAFTLGFYYCATMLISFLLIKERGMGAPKKEEDTNHIEHFEAHLSEDTKKHLHSLDTKHSEHDLRADAAAMHGKTADISKREPTPLVTGLLSTLNNKPFVQLLPAWAADSVNFSVMSSLLMYYVQYVVQPEYTNDCTAGDPNDADNPSAIYKAGLCGSTWVTAYALVAILVCAMCTLPLWQALAKRFGKRNAWLTWSCVNAITNLAVLPVGAGDIYLFIGCAGLNGIPLGASFLSDSILSDIIDYDELLTGTRNEATYTMFKSFLPKICAIPASVIPISLLSSFGYIPPMYQVPQIQPDSAVLYLRLVFCVVPLTFALISFYIKTFFIMKTREQVTKIGTGIGRHLIGLPSICPFSDATVVIHHYEPGTETHLVGILGHFVGEAPIDLLLKNGGADQLLQTTKRQLTIAIASIVCAVSSASLTCWYLISTDISFVPAVNIVMVGITTVVLLFAIFRRAAAGEIKRAVTSGMLTPSLLQKVKVQRKMLGDTHKVAHHAKPHWTPKRSHVLIAIGCLLVLVVGAYLDKGGRRCQTEEDSKLDSGADCRTGGFLFGLVAASICVVGMGLLVARRRGYCLHLNHPCEHHAPGAPERDGSKPHGGLKRGLSKEMSMGMGVQLSKMQSTIRMSSPKNNPLFDQVHAAELEDEEEEGGAGKKDELASPQEQQGHISGKEHLEGRKMGCLDIYKNHDLRTEIGHQHNHLTEHHHHHTNVADIPGALAPGGRQVSMRDVKQSAAL